MCHTAEYENGRLEVLLEIGSEGREEEVFSHSTRELRLGGWVYYVRRISR